MSDQGYNKTKGSYSSSNKVVILNGEQGKGILLLSYEGTFVLKTRNLKSCLQSMRQ